MIINSRGSSRQPYALGHKIAVSILFLCLSLKPIYASDQAKCSGTIVFPGDHFNTALKKFSGNGPFDGLTGVTLQNTEITLGPSRHDDNYLGPVFDFSMHLAFDATSIVDQWVQAINQQANDQNGCSSSRVHSIEWHLESNDTWVGSFHVDYKKRACFDYWWFGARHAQIDLAEVNVVFVNKLKIQIDPNGNHITTQFTPTATNNIPDWLKPILQLFENVIAILTLGFVQPDEHVLSGIKIQDQILSDMGKYAVDLIHQHLKDIDTRPSSNDAQLEFLNHLVHKTVAFSRPTSSQLSIDLVEGPSDGNLPPGGAVCRVHDPLYILRVQDENIPFDGLDYETQAGDNGWKIAESKYGNGRFFLLISAANNITDYDLDRLPVGRHLRIETVATLRSRPDLLLIMNGQNIWQIASSADKGTYAALLNANKDWFKDPNLIYPIQVLKIPPKPN